jgi:hypothetical protein
MRQYFEHKLSIVHMFVFLMKKIHAAGGGAFWHSGYILNG